VYPDWKFNFTTQYGYDAWSGGFNVRFINGYTEFENQMGWLRQYGVEVASREVDSNTTVNLFATYTLDWRASQTKVQVGINNVLDKDPPWIATGFYANSDADYDFLGRYYYLRLTESF